MSDDLLIYDLYCSAGGVGLAIERIAEEYWPNHDVTHVGVDIEDYSEEYAGEFIQADASQPPLKPNPDLLWMSPPCQAYSNLSHVHYEDPKEAHPTFSDLRVREVIDELNPSDYIVENVASCDDLQEPARLNGYGVGYEFGLERWFETSYDAPNALERGTSIFNCSHGIGDSYTEVAVAKDVPSSWGKTAVRSAIPQKMVQYLFHYCPSVPETPLPDGVDRQTLLTEIEA